MPAQPAGNTHPPPPPHPPITFTLIDISFILCFVSHFASLPPRRPPCLTFNLTGSPRHNQFLYLFSIFLLASFRLPPWLLMVHFAYIVPRPHALCRVIAAQLNVSVVLLPSLFSLLLLFLFLLHLVHSLVPFTHKLVQYNLLNYKTISFFEDFLAESLCLGGNTLSEGRELIKSR